MTPTPGPWSVHHGDELQRSDGVICETGNGWEVRPAIGTLLGDEQADLKLIALVPDMMYAIKMCAFALEPYDDVKPRDWKTDRERLRFAHQVVTKLIEKATT